MRWLWILFLTSSLYAGTRPFPDSFVSQGIYVATNTSVESSSSVIIISSYACIIHNVMVNTAGTSSNAEIFNTNVSSSVNSRIAKIDTTAKNSFLYDVFLSSGLTLTNYGTTPADITLSYMPIK